MLNLKTHTGILYYQCTFMKTKAADIITMQGNKGLRIQECKPEYSGDGWTCTCGAM